MQATETTLKQTWQNEIIYQIFIDRFAGYDGTKDPLKPDFMGGTISGIIDNIDYIHALGATAIYLTPFFTGVAYHGYHTTDFFTIDKRFGSLDNLKTLIAKAHKLNLKVIIDFVPNHCSNQHPYFVEAQTNPNSHYKDWFIFTNWPYEYKTFLQVAELPKLNLDTPAARNHIIDAAIYWVETLDVDGLRLDHVIGPSVGFWNDFRIRLKAVKPALLLLAEVNLDGVIMPRDNPTLNLPLDWRKLVTMSTMEAKHTALMLAYKGLFDGYIDFAFDGIVRDFVRGKIDHAETVSKVRKHQSELPTNLIFPTQLDNHDMDRIMFVARDRLERVIEAISLQFDYSQPKIIYYGSELGMTQTKSMYNGTDIKDDIVARQPMPNLAARDMQHPILHHYKNLTNRSQEPLLP